jgi:hypothetical protein
MHTIASTWHSSIMAFDAFMPHYEQHTRARLQRDGLCYAWLPLLRSAGAGDRPLSSARLTALTPYVANARRRELIAAVQGEGLLEVTDGSVFQLTPRGRQSLYAYFDTAHSALGAIHALPEAQMEDLAGLLARIVAAAERLPLPRLKENLRSSRATDPGLLAPAAVRIDQYLTDLMHFRADAHFASWHAYGVDGRTWEAFTYIWRNQANTPADLAEALAQRGHDEAAYTEAVQLLLQKGWVERAAGRWQVAATGRALREVAEMVTDRLFFAAWKGLNETELRRLDDLLLALTDSLKAQGVPEPVLDAA